MASAERMFAERSEAAQRQLPYLQAAIDQQAGIIKQEQATATGPASQPAAKRMSDARNELARLEGRMTVAEETAKADRGPPWIKTVDNALFWVTTFVPKTSETVGLMDRTLFKDAELQEMLQAEQAAEAEDSGPQRGGPRGLGTSRTQAQVISLQTASSRNMFWILGSSLAFEAVMLALAAWVFCRRDY